jgi:cytochrome c peroxidase
MDSGWITGVPLRPSVIDVTVIARDVRGDSAIQQLPIVIFASGLPMPVANGAAYPYSRARVPLPRHFLFDPSGPAMTEDNTPSDNRTTDAGAALGRVLFYDTRLSVDDRMSCASCHQQRFSFADTARFSRGVDGAPTSRHVMALANARFYLSGRFFRDERAPTLERQVLVPVGDPREMALAIDAMVVKLRLTPYYAPLFQAAFGTPDIDSTRVAQALAQFVRSLVTFHARYDSIFRGNGPPNVASLTAREAAGRSLFFSTRVGCSRCHRTNAFELDHTNNIGLEGTPVDPGAGGGKFKVSSLRNVAVRPPYMHDGRFRTLKEVIDFYDHGVRETRELDPRLRGADGKPQRLHLSRAERDALLAFLAALTDQSFLHDPRFADPFDRR